MCTALSGCKREKAIDPVNLNDLNGTWRLVQPTSSYNSTLVLEMTISHPILPVTSTGFRASGKAAVNAYSTLLGISLGGSYKISVGEITTTFVGGSTEAVQFERTYLASLQAVNRFELTNQNRLRLYYTSPQLGLLVYEKAP